MGMRVPKFWRDEVGELPGAVMAYVNHVAEPKLYPVPTDEQLKLFVAYLGQWAFSEVWRGGAELARLRKDVKGLSTVEEVKAWIWRCVRLGMDPL